LIRQALANSTTASVRPESPNKVFMPLTVTVGDAVSHKHGKQRFDNKSVGFGDDVPAVLGGAGLGSMTTFAEPLLISVVRGCPAPSAA
jgi:hypothetical protein